MTALWTVLGAPLVIDLSHHNQGPIDFAALYADGVRMVIHKASQGTRMVDPMYAARRKKALAAGLKFEAYHFCDSAPAKDQMEHFLAVAEPDDTMRLALDAEPNGNSTIGFVNVNIFAALLDGRRNRQCLRYTGAGFLTPEAVRSTPDFRAGPFWWAKYGPAPRPDQLAPLGIAPARLVLWQETASGHRKGISGPIDESYWLGTAAELDAYPVLPKTYPGMT